MSSNMTERLLPRFVRSPSLRTVFLAQVVLPVLAALFLTFSGGLYAVERLIEQRMKEDIELIARTIRLPVSYSLRNDRPVSLLNALESVFDIGRVYGAHVYNREGEKVASVGVNSPAASSNVDIRSLLASRVGDTKGGGTYERVDGLELYSYFVPLTDPRGKQAGILQVTRRFSDFTDYMQNLRIRAMTAFGLVFLFIVGMILLSHHRAIGRPLRALVHSMERVGTGELEHRAQVTGPAEIAAIGREFNTMLDSIEQARAEILRRQQAETELIEQLRENEKLAAIGRLSAGIAHELGTPLSVIDGRARRMAQRTGSERTHDARDLNTIRSEVQCMSLIVQQLMDFGRGRTTDHRPVTVGRVCRTALGGVREAADRHGVEIKYNPPEHEAEVWGDALRLEQAITNLLRNAIQSAEGGRVRLSVHLDASEASVLVEDNGPGVPKSTRHQIFEPFYTTKPVGSGSGLGLSVVRGVAEEHDGRTSIRVSDALGGACFGLHLPLQTETHDKERS